MGAKHHCAFVECLAAGSHDLSIIHLLLGVILECHKVALSHFLQSMLLGIMNYLSFFPSHSRSDRDAREAAAITSQYVCPFSKQLVADMKEDTDGSE